jgi:hypothetical protein
MKKTINSREKKRRLDEDLVGCKFREYSLENYAQGFLGLMDFEGRKEVISNYFEELLPWIMPMGN